MHELERRNASRHGALRAVPNLSWVDQQEKHVGEVDVVILDSQDNVVALVEVNFDYFFVLFFFFFKYISFLLPLKIYFLTVEGSLF